mgnify:CR=1 FL=1
MKFARVALDVPLNRLFDYRTDTVTDANVGSIVLAPFGKKIVVGVGVRTIDPSKQPCPVCAS